MAAGSKEKELEDTLPGAEDLAVSAEASELRRRLLAVGSNDNAERQRSAARSATPPPVAVEQPASDERALRATLQFVRRRPAGNEEVTVTAVSGAPLPPRPEATPQSEADAPEVRPSRARVVVPLVAGVLLVVVPLIHRSLSQREPAPAAPLANTRAAGVLVPAPLEAPRTKAAAESAASKVKGASIAPAAPGPITDPAPAPTAVESASAGSRSKAVPRAKVAPAPREQTRAPEPSVAPAKPEPAVSDAPAPAPSAKPRPRLVEDRPRPSLLD